MLEFFSFLLSYCCLFRSFQTLQIVFGISFILKLSVSSLNYTEYVLMYDREKKSVSWFPIRASHGAFQYIYQTFSPNLIIGIFRYNHTHFSFILYDTDSFLCMWLYFTVKFPPKIDLSQKEFVRVHFLCLKYVWALFQNTFKLLHATMNRIFFSVSMIKVGLIWSKFSQLKLDCEKKRSKTNCFFSRISLYDVDFLFLIYCNIKTSCVRVFFSVLL